MTTTREQVMTALLARLSTAYSWGVVGRRNRAPNAIAAVGKPALILLKQHETYVARGLNMPSKRTMHLLAVVYVDVGTDETAVPDALVNAALDALDAAMQPDSPGGYLTLGGLVESAKISGTITAAPGDVTGKGLAIVPIDVSIP